MRKTIRIRVNRNIRVMPNGQVRVTTVVNDGKSVKTSTKTLRP